MRVGFVGTVAKDPRDPASNEDAYKISVDSNLIVVSDGASESFDSRTWAHEIVSSLDCIGRFSNDWLTKAVATYQSRFDRSKFGWAKESAFERGSFATILAAEFDVTDATLALLAVGDSVAFVLEDGELRVSFPYISSAEFDNRPLLLSTMQFHNTEVQEVNFLAEHTAKLKISSSCVVLLMTDALARWVLECRENNDDAWRALLTTTDDHEFAELVLQARRQRTIRLDDVTFVRASIEP